MRERPNDATMPAWEADLTPVAARIGDDAAARPAVVLVTAGPIPVHVDMLAHPPSDAAGVARTLEEAVATAVERVGASPTELLVRTGEVARLLSRAGPLHDTTVRAADDLPAIDLFLREMAAGAPDMGFGGRVALPETWGGWGLPDDVIAELFRAAAAYHRAAPWRVVTNAQVLDATLPAGHTWTVCILGNGGQEFGLSLYERREDFGALLEAADPSDAFDDTRGAILSLTFDAGPALPKRMRREIAARGWEVAGRNAYPTLFAVNTLGGGVTREQAADLTTLLRVVPAFVDRYRDALAGDVEVELPIEWADEAAGVRIRYDGFEPVMEETIWGPHAVLTPSLAAGPGAEPAASLLRLAPPAALGAAAEAEDEKVEERERAVVERFRAWLQQGRQRVGATTARRLAADVLLFVEFLTDFHGVPVRAVSEYDLRVFLYDWYPRKVRAPLKTARAVHRAVERFFEFLAEREGIVCEWAEVVLDEHEWFELRLEEFPGGHWWDAEVREWQQEVWDDLEARIMYPHAELGDGETWGATMGTTEHALRHTLQRAWLAWRDEVIRSGTTAPEAVRAALIPRQHAWLRTPLPELGGRTPVEAILAERRERPGLRDLDSIWRQDR